MDFEAKIGLRLDGISDDLKGLRSDQREAQTIVQELLRGQKFIWLPKATGTVASSAVTFGGATNTAFGPAATPDQGFIWSVRFLAINGLTASPSTPDVIDIKINNDRVWQLNGNSFAQTWSRGEMLLRAGDAFQYVNNGTLAATGLITAIGWAEEVPAEMQGKVW